MLSVRQTMHHPFDPLCLTGIPIWTFETWRSGLTAVKLTVPVPFRRLCSGASLHPSPHERWARKCARGCIALSFASYQLFSRLIRKIAG